MEELLDIYDDSGVRIGLASRRLCHGNPTLLHHTSHVIVIHPDREHLLLQKRSLSKDIQPGKWDTAVGGHLDPGEDYLAGARRELAEELGVTGEVELRHLFDSQIRNEIESEDTRVFAIVHPGPFRFQREEIDEVRFWSFEELRNPANFGEFTPNLWRNYGSFSKGITCDAARTHREFPVPARGAPLLERLARPAGRGGDSDASSAGTGRAGAGQRPAAVPAERSAGRGVPFPSHLFCSGQLRISGRTAVQLRIRRPVALGGAATCPLAETAADSSGLSADSADFPFRADEAEAG